MEPHFPNVTIRVPNYPESMFSLVMRGHLGLCLIGEKEKAEEFRTTVLASDSEHLYQTVHEWFTLHVGQENE